MPKNKIDIKYSSDCFHVQYFDEDPDGAEDRAGDGYYFQIEGEEGWSGAWHSEEEAEQEAFEELNRNEEKSIISELKQEGFLCVDHDSERMRFFKESEGRWFGIVLTSDFARAFESFGPGQSNVFTTIEIEENEEPTIGQRHKAARQACEVIELAMQPESGMKP
jgi:hypothetical protein